MAEIPAEKIRIDKWLWQARFFQSRPLAAQAVESGVRVDGTRASKPSRSVGPGDTLTFAQEKQIRVIRIVEIGTRRGPAPEAQALYEDLTPVEEPSKTAGNTAISERGGRPSKRDRRQLIKTKRHTLD